MTDPTNMSGASAESPVELVQLMKQVLDRLAKGEHFTAVDEATNISSRVREAIQAQSRPAFLVIQEGGSSAEFYVHAHDSFENAEDDRTDCARDAYRTSPIVEVPGALAAHGEVFYELIEDIIAASQEFT
jgi:hypothetical protein